MIGPSGCGKSTFIRCLNRMNDLVPGRAGRRAGSSTTARTSTAREADPVEVRRRIGMVFQRPNPFPKSIYDNVAFAPKVLGMKGNIDERVERALRGAALWDEVKDRLKSSALAALRRPAAAALHRARAGGRARGHPPRRARLRARPDLDGGDRGPDARAQAGLHARDRHPQHAAGRPGRGHDGVLQPRRLGRQAARRSSSSTTRPRSSSPTRPTSEPRTTSPAGSADARHLPRGARRSRAAAPGGGRPRPPVAARGAHVAGAPGRRARRRGDRASTTTSTTRTSRSSRASRTCSPCRRRSRSTCG